MEKDLSQLLKTSSSTRSYFTSLPVWLQLELHSSHNDYLHTAGQLHYVVDFLQKQNDKSKQFY